MPEVFSDLPCQIERLPNWTRYVTRRFMWEHMLLPLRNLARFSVVLNPHPVCPPCLRLPTIPIVHDLTPLRLRHLHPPRYKATFWADLQTLRLAPAVVAVSNSTRADLERLELVRSERIRVIHEGPGIMPDQAPKYQDSIARPFLLYVGGLWTHKNVVRLVHAFARLKQSELSLVLVGGGPTVGVLRAAESLGVARRITLLNSVTDARLSWLYSNCRAFVFPSLYEGFGLPVLEAMAHSAPIAVSRSSSLPEVAGEAALYFDPESVTQMTETIGRLLANPLEAESLGRLAALRSTQFSWRACADSLAETARALCESAPE
jgi:alpha-1,3-rhamnosyl/mannosyltransferase